MDSMNSGERIVLPVLERRPNPFGLVLMTLLTVAFNLALFLGAAALGGAWRGGAAFGLGEALRALDLRNGLALLLLLVYVDVALISGTLRRFRYRKGAGPVVFFGDRFEVPDVSGHARHDLAFADVLLVQLGRRYVFIDARHRLIRIPRSFFASLADLENFLRLVHRGIARLPDGSERLAAMAQRLMLAESAYRRPMIASFRLVFFFALVYLVQQLLRAPFNQGDIALGANVAALTREGQLFRIVSANVLHANLLHLGVNGFALLSLGSVLERLLGRERFLVLFLGACVFGAMASTLLAGHAIGLGSSTGVAGLLGSLLYLAVRYREKLPTEFRQPWSLWLTLLALNAWLALLVPNIDHVAHAGGFLAGVILTAGLCPYHDPIDLLQRPPSVLLQVSARVLIGVLAAVLVVGVTSRWDHLAEDTMKTWESWAESASGEQLNFVAWTEVAEKEFEAPRSWLPIRFVDEAQQLELGALLARRATALEPENHHFRDTLATVLYRQGRLDEAIALARRFQVEGLEDFGASQLARFELDRLRLLGSPVLTSTLAPPALEREAGLIVLRFPEAPRRSAEVHVVLHRGREPLGLLRLNMGPSEVAELRIECPPAVCEVDGAEVESALGLYDPTIAPLPRESVDSRLNRYDAEVAKLPRLGAAPPG